MIEIPVSAHSGDFSRCCVAVVDEDDADLLSFRWSATGGDERTRYARRSIYPAGLRGRSREEQMHRVIAGRLFGVKEIQGKEVDHINGNGLDNRRSNLRLASRRQNNANRTGFGKSQYLGVAWSKREGKWQAQLRSSVSQQDDKGHGRMIWLGYHETEEGAARAYDEAAAIHHGEYARKNFPS